MSGILVYVVLFCDLGLMSLAFPNRVLHRAAFATKNSHSFPTHFSKAGTVRQLSSHLKSSGPDRSPASGCSTQWTVTCNSPEDIEAFGAKIADVVDNSDIILLRGDLGAGKTTFTRGLIRRKFDDEDMRVTSPSYLLDNTYQYDEDKYIHHIDLYRLPTGCDLSILGIPDIYRNSLCIIEWPQRMGTNLPTEYLDIDIKITNDEDGARSFRLEAHGDSWIRRLSQLLS
jgi:tRNA threonylcarbamoyladenosine biosynthesis protein TsaE